MRVAKNCSMDARELCIGREATPVAKIRVRRRNSKSNFGMERSGSASRRIRKSLRCELKRMAAAVAGFRHLRELDCELGGAGSAAIGHEALPGIELAGTAR